MSKAPSAQDPSARKPLVYCVDDDPALGLVMSARFSKYGCDVETFTKAEDLLARIKIRIPKLIVVDLNLGDGLSGYDLIERVRKDVSLELPMIVVSGEGQNSLIAHALELGATDFLAKPPQREEFEAKVARYLSAKELPQQSRAPLQPVAEEAQRAKIGFQIAVHEVSPLGLTLASSHLIKKGTSFWLSGESIRKITPSFDRIFVTAIGSAVQAVGEGRQYLIRVEIDPTAPEVLQEVRAFLGRMKLDLPPN